jgi:hypothetical protein
MAKRISEADGNLEVFPDIIGSYEKEGQKRKQASSASKLSKKTMNQDTNVPKPATASTVTFGRKSIRAIMNDLQRRILALQTNPAQWDALQQKVNKYYTPESRTVTNTIRANKKVVLHFSPDAKRKKILAAVTSCKRRNKGFERNRAKCWNGRDCWMMKY